MEDIFDVEMPEDITAEFLGEYLRAGVNPDEITEYPLNVLVGALIVKSIRDSKKAELTQKDIRNIILKSHKKVSDLCHSIMAATPGFQEHTSSGVKLKQTYKSVWWKDIVLVIWTIIRWIGIAAFFITMMLLDAQEQKTARENEPGWGMKNPTLHSNALQWDRTFNGNRVGTHFSRWSSGFRYASHSVCGNKMYIIVTNGRYQETIEVNLRTGCSMNKGRRVIT